MSYDEEDETMPVTTRLKRSTSAHGRAGARWAGRRGAPDGFQVGDRRTPGEPQPGADGREPRIPRGVRAVSALLIVLGGLCVAGLTATVVWTSLGQRADERSRWSMGVPDEVGDTLIRWLDMVSVGLVAAAIVGCVLVALVRGAWGRALGAAVLIAGANVSTQVLKAAIPRPQYGIGAGIGADNSLPSGHTTVMVSLCLAAMLVLPRVVRLPMVFVTSAAGTLTGAATIIQRWHRPSDVVAAVAVCGAWAGVGLLVSALMRRRARPAPETVSSVAGGAAGHRSRLRWHVVVALSGAVAVGVCLLAGGLVAHGEPSNVVVAATVLTACGLTSACAAVLVGQGVDLLDDAERVRPT